MLNHKISIHAPLAGRDDELRIKKHDPVYFNPRAPCGARRLSRLVRRMQEVFQSTRPLRGATSLLSILLPVVDISIHAPLAGRDDEAEISALMEAEFQSTRPLRGATRAIATANCIVCDFNPRAPCGARRLRVYHDFPVVQISIHAPLAGRDALRRNTSGRPAYFNPRAPCGARLSRGEKPIENTGISIHAPLAGRDGKSDEFSPADLRK